MHGQWLHQCCHLKSQLYNSRKDSVKDLFDPQCWPEPEPGIWTASYFDLLPKESQTSRDAASRLLRSFAMLGWPQILSPSEEGLSQQDSTSCGLYCLHWAEALLREVRGEGPSQIALQLAECVGREIEGRQGSQQEGSTTRKPGNQLRIRPQLTVPDPAPDDAVYLTWFLNTLEFIEHIKQH